MVTEQQFNNLLEDILTRNRIRGNDFKTIWTNCPNGSWLLSLIRQTRIATEQDYVSMSIRFALAGDCEQEVTSFPAVQKHLQISRKYRGSIDPQNREQITLAAEKAAVYVLKHITREVFIIATEPGCEWDHAAVQAQELACANVIREVLPFDVVLKRLEKEYFGRPEFEKSIMMPIPSTVPFIQPFETEIFPIAPLGYKMADAGDVVEEGFGFLTRFGEWKFINTKLDPSQKPLLSQKAAKNQYIRPTKDLLWKEDFTGIEVGLCFVVVVKGKYVTKTADEDLEQGVSFNCIGRKRYAHDDTIEIISDHYHGARFKKGADGIYSYYDEKHDEPDYSDLAMVKWRSIDLT